MKNKLLIYLSSLAVCWLFMQPVKAQLNSFAAGYFQKQYLLNPAMGTAGIKKADIAAGYRKQGNITNGPISLYLTGNYVFTEKMGAGINVFVDKAGLLNTVKLMGTYNYSIQVGSDKQRLHFGLSAGGVQLRLNNRDVNGNLDDPGIYNYNDQFMKFEADFGAAYTDGKLTVQAAFPNMVSHFSNDNKNAADRATFFAAASYKWNVNNEEEGISIEPKLVYRGIAGHDNIIDAGANISALKNRVNVFGLYHSSKNITAGLGIRISDLAQLSAAYTTQSSDYKAYSNGDYELGLRFFIK